VIRGRLQQLSDDQLGQAARELAGDALAPADKLLDIELGNLRRFQDNGIEQQVPAPRWWARAIPLTRGLTIATYTRDQVLFLGEGLGVNCPVERVHRAELHDDDRQTFAFGRGESPLSVLELERVRHPHDPPAAFLKRLLAARDEGRARLPAEAREVLERLDQVFLIPSLADLWKVTPPAARA
jgi:hypothetical protein